MLLQIASNRAIRAEDILEVAAAMDGDVWKICMLVLSPVMGVASFVSRGYEDAQECANDFHRIRNAVNDEHFTGNIVDIGFDIYKGEGAGDET